MIRNLFRKKNDDAISPVIGTILMVAATVIIGGAVYAAVNAYSGKASKTTTDAAFKAQSMDTDSNGLEDAIKLTYLSGPRDMAAGTVTISVKDADGTALTRTVQSHSNATGAWNAGDYEIYELPAAALGGNVGTIFVSVAVADTTVLDQTLTLRE